MKWLLSSSKPLYKKPESKIRNRSRDIDENNNVTPTMRNARQAPPTNDRMTS